MVFTAFFALLGLWPVIHGKPIRLLAIYTSASFLLITLTRPDLLGPLNHVWTRLGQLLSNLTRPLLAGLMFYLIFTPIGMILRMFGKDLLPLKYEPDATTYWIRRDRLTPNNMRNQF